MHLTDGRTDGQTDGRTEFSSQDRVCIPCSAVKIKDVIPGIPKITECQAVETTNYYYYYYVSYYVTLLVHTCCKHATGSTLASRPVNCSWSYKRQGAKYLSRF